MSHVGEVYKFIPSLSKFNRIWGLRNQWTKTCERQSLCWEFMLMCTSKQRTKHRAVYYVGASGVGISMSPLDSSAVMNFIFMGNIFRFSIFRFDRFPYGSRLGFLAFYLEDKLLLVSLFPVPWNDVFSLSVSLELFKPFDGCRPNNQCVNLRFNWF